MTSGSFDVSAAPLLALVGHVHLAAFFGHSADAAASREIETRLGLAQAASEEQARARLAFERLSELGRDIGEFSQLMIPVLDTFEEGVSPGHWTERLLKSYIGHGVLIDLVREFTSCLDSEEASLLDGLTDSCAGQGFVLEELRLALEENDKLSSRLALWGRRVVGESLSIVQRLLADVPELAEIQGMDSADVDSIEMHAPKVFGRLTAAHARRMSGLGLTA